MVLRLLPFFGSIEIPVSDLAVKWPDGRILGSFTMLSRDPDFRRFCSLEMRVEKPDFGDLNPVTVEMRANGILAIGRRKARDRKLPKTFDPRGDSFEDTVLVGADDCFLLFLLMNNSNPVGWIPVQPFYPVCKRRSRRD